MSPPSGTASATVAGAPGSSGAPAGERSAEGPRAAGRKLWIDAPLRDLALYVATPLFLIPLILLRHDRPGVQDLILYIGGFGALGHHLPGMMRAYGDRALFRRFRVRFLVAPLFLVPICVYFSLNGLGGIILVTFFWTNWHSLMQIFGFARIYDAKVGSTLPWTARLDHALAVAWIGAPLLLSDSRFGSILDLWYGSGGPLLAPSFLHGLQTFWMWGTAVVTAAWAIQGFRAARHGEAPSPVKLLFLATSFGFWWFCMAFVDNLLVGVALFDVFHDVQYLGIVWTFNRARVQSDPSVGSFSRFLFRGRATLAGVYVGLVLAYGSLGYVGERVDDELVSRTLIGVLAASALLHFYFDGFIWKVRERSTRAALAVDGGGDDIRLGGAFLPAWAAHGAKWLGFVVPLGIFYWWETTDERPERVWREAIVDTVPTSGEALSALAASMDIGRERTEVLALHERAIAAKPSDPVSHNNYGVALLLVGRVDEARAQFEEAVRLYPKYSTARRHLASLLVAAGDPRRAEEHFQAAIDAAPREAPAHAGLGVLRAQEGDMRGAADAFERALTFDRNEKTALNGLAWLRATAPDASLRDGAAALALAERLVELTGGGDPMVLDTLAAAQAEAGDLEAAVTTIHEALSLAQIGGEAGIVGVLGEHRDRYVSGAPWRDER